MIKYRIITVFAAMFLLFACENNIKTKNDTAPQNDEAAVTDDDGEKDDKDISDLKDELVDGDIIATDDTLPDDAQPDDTQPDDAQPDDSLPDSTQPDDTQPDDAQPDDAQPDITPVDEALPDNDVSYPTTSSISYNKTVEPWSGGANILEGNAVIVDMIGQPPALFTTPDSFIGSKSFIDVSIYREDHSAEYVRVRFSRAEMTATELPVTIVLQQPFLTKSLMTISQAEWFNGEMVNGFLTGILTITGFNEGEAPGSPVILIFSGDDLVFTPTN